MPHWRRTPARRVRLICWLFGGSTVAASVTDVLVDRGDDLVVASAARNRGASFSISGFSELASRSKDNGDLALCVWSRPDIPGHELIKLFGQATEIVRRKLEAADPRRAALIRTAVANASDEIQATTRAGSNEHATAMTHVQSLHARGQLDEARLFDFAPNAEISTERPSRCRSWASSRSV